MACYTFLRAGKVVAEAYNWEDAKRISMLLPDTEFRGDGILNRAEDPALRPEVDPEIWPREDCEKPR